MIFFFYHKDKYSSLIISPLRNQHPPSPQYNHRNHLLQSTLPARVHVLRYLRCLPKRFEETILPTKSVPKRYFGLSQPCLS